MHTCMRSGLVEFISFMMDRLFFEYKVWNGFTFGAVFGRVFYERTI